MRGRVKDIFVYVLVCISLGFEFFFGILSGVGFILQVILLALIVSAVSRFFRKSSQASFFDSLQIQTMRIFAVFGFFTSMLLAFILYYNSFPGKISDITLVHGKQNIIFLSMSHIATPDFYREKRSKIESYAKKGYTILIEGVSPGKQESHDTFNTALGMDFSQDLYPAFAQIAGLEVQSGGLLFQGIDDSLLKHVDMSMDEIASLIVTKSGAELTTPESLDMVAELQKISHFPQGEQIFIKYIVRAFLNWSIANMTDIAEITNENNKALFDIILTKRNDKIIDYIRKNPGENIVIVYGALHFPGVYESLKNIDKSTRIESFESSSPYVD